MKDAVTLQLKAAQMRRELLSLSAEAGKDDESDALNFFFCPVSREEMEKMKRVEVFYGSGDDDAVLASLVEDKKEDEESQHNTTQEVLAEAEDEVEFL